jgi:hypothetical protein
MGNQEVSVEEVLIQTDTIPVIDGGIEDNEYSVSIETSKIYVHLSMNNGTIYFGLEGQTTGWLAIGFGSMGMDKAHIVIGYLKDGQVSVKEQRGIGHGHKETDEIRLLEFSLIESGGTNVFEGAFSSNGLIPDGEEYLSLITACGNTDNFTSHHTFRKSLSVKLE